MLHDPIKQRINLTLIPQKGAFKRLGDDHDDNEGLSDADIVSKKVSKHEQKESVLFVVHEGEIIFPLFHEL